MSTEQTARTAGGLDLIFEQFKDSFVAELEKKDDVNRHLQSELDRVNEENNRLLKLLSTNLLAVDHVTTASDAAREDKRITAKDAEEMVAFTKYSELQKLYHSTYKSMEAAITALDRYKAKHKKHAESIRLWQAYADRCERKLAEKKGFLTPERSSIACELQKPTGDPSIISSPTPTSDHEAFIERIRRPVSRSSPLVSVEKGDEHQPQLRGPSKLAMSVTTDVTDGPTTTRDAYVATTTVPVDAGIYNRLIRKDPEPRSSETEDSDDLPRDADHNLNTPTNKHEFRVPVTTIKRKLEVLHSDPDDRLGSMATPIQIKSEPKSSPRIGPIIGMHRTETLDLDEVGDHIETPRRKRQRMLQQGSSFSLSFPGPGLANQTPLGMAAHNMYSQEFTNKKILSANTVLQNQVTAVFDKNTTPISTRRTRAHDSSKVLSPLSPNRADLPRGRKTTAKPGAESKTSKGRKLDWMSVAEDGDSISTFQPATLEGRHSIDNLLDVLLDNPVPLEQLLITPATTRRTRLSAGFTSTAVENTDSAGSCKTPANRRLPTPTTGGIANALERSEFPTSQGPASRSSGTRVAPPPANAKKSEILVRSNRSKLKGPERLRNRAETALKPEDFKINPHAYGDLDHTNAEPVRDHESRRHLQGCTDPNCFQCGSALRALAEALPITVGSTLFASTQEDDLTNEERLLKHHLGFRFDQAAIARMPEVQRKELIMEAKIQIVADRHSRHRMRPNARAKSPPGFWDVDMPTTQEIDARNAEADKRARVVVRERYREAMRPNGKWMFRDE